ncbi:MAG TPA: recombinase family protein [Dehalococcoidia bacterium]|nr:recombinase family protein [Dehalococcoidia bacterium]
MNTYERISVAAYLRVSSDDQRDRETIKTQKDAIERFLASRPEYQLYRWYDDDGVSGTVPMAKRPQGRLMVADANAGKFSKIIVYRSSRLGREEENKFAVYNLFVEALGIELVGIMEDLSDRMVFGVHTVIDAYARRQFLADTARGMDRAAREGRYTGGVVHLGYKVEGRKPFARLVPNEDIFWSDWTAADLVRRIYHWLAVDRRSCRWIALELNQLGVPTVYQHEGRGVRGKSTQALWRPGRIRNLVVNTMYKGTFRYGRRRSKNSKRTETIEAAVPPLVSEEVWRAAQDTLSANRLLAKNSDRVYLLRGVVKCGLCGLTYCGANGRKGVWWYRCNGYLAERGGKDHRCQARSVKNTDIEPLVWSDIEALLRNPGSFLDVLKPEMQVAPDEAAAEAERQLASLKTALTELGPRRQRNLDLFERGRISSQELDDRLDQISSERKLLETRREAIHIPEREEPTLDVDLLGLIRDRLDAGLTPEQRNEIVRLLVKQITVFTTVNAEGGKDLRFAIEYRFSSSWCSQDCNGTGSWLRPA